jgi:hypothetical protein
MKRLILIALVGLMLTGCTSYIVPSDRLVIHADYLNTAITCQKVQADPACPTYAKIWWSADAKIHCAYDQWAQGKGSIATDANGLPATK